MSRNDSKTLRSLLAAGEVLGLTLVIMTVLGVLLGEPPKSPFLVVVLDIFGVVGNAVLVCLPVLAWMLAREEGSRWTLAKDLAPYVVGGWVIGFAIGHSLDAVFGSHRFVDDLFVWPPQFLLAGLGAWFGNRKRRAATEARNTQA